MILTWPNFWISPLFFFVRWKHCPVTWKNFTKMNGICTRNVVSSPNFHRLCVLIIHTFWYVNMPDVTTGDGRAFILSEHFEYSSVCSEHYSYYGLHRDLRLPQIVRLINTHILMYRHARCNCRLWQVLWFVGCFQPCSVFGTLYHHQIITDYVPN